MTRTAELPDEQIPHLGGEIDAVPDAVWNEANRLLEMVAKTRKKIIEDSLAEISKLSVELEGVCEPDAVGYYDFHCDLLGAILQPVIDKLEDRKK